jgi:dCTP deaminase
MIINGTTLLHYEPIKDMLAEKVRGGVTSHGLSEAGYDVRVKQDIVFTAAGVEINGIWSPSNFTLASTIGKWVGWLPDP